MGRSRGAERVVVTLRRFTTPGGHIAEIECREGTNDAMVAEAVIEHDEYGRHDLIDVVGGHYVDIGAHLANWLISALLDDHTATGVAVEPVPENVALIHANLEANGLTDRVEVIPKAFAKRGPVTIHYEFHRDGDDEAARMATMHRFIGNQRMGAGTHARESIKVPAITPGTLFRERVDALKIDAEGAEVALIGANLKNVGALLILILILMVRPQGIFGRAERVG